MTATIQNLRDKLGELSDIGATVALMGWDQQVNMPKKAAPGRGQQLATMSAIYHRMATAPEFGDMLRKLNDERDKLSADEAKMVEETLWDYERSTKLPEAFVKELTELDANAFAAWQEARKDSDFAAFQPFLERLVVKQREMADMFGFEGSPYNALVENYERGMTAERLTQIFGDLREKQSALIEKIVASPNQPDIAWLEQDWDEQAQWDFGMKVLTEMGYDLDAGRQDKSTHPFTTEFGLKDVRVTTRFDVKDLFSAMSSTMHEGGHALYEQGFLESDARTTLGSSISLGVHESQSRMWENLIGRSRPFWQHYLPVLKEHFPGQLNDVDVDKMYRSINAVKPSLIRVEADECTYNLHIIIRFEIETALLEGRMKVSELPEVWNAKYKEYLGVDVPNDAQGCLQDVHWSGASFGYFPTYALGNLYASQMFEKILQDIPNLWESIAGGNMLPLLDWLRKNVHEVGRRKKAPQLIEGITGKLPESTAYLNYLTTKYGELYGVK
ncbi:carboxypeptidase M32 [bacterium]|nr:carboxypeptidase M32 [bacterium]